MERYQLCDISCCVHCFCMQVSKQDNLEGAISQSVTNVSHSQHLNSLWQLFICLQISVAFSLINWGLFHCFRFFIIRNS